MGDATTVRGVALEPRRTQRSASRRACDLCFVQKEKCVYPDGGHTCERCQRLNKACATHRPIRPSGRRRLLPFTRDTRLSDVPIFAVNQRPTRLPISLSPFGVLYKDLAPSDRVMVVGFLDASTIRQLMVIPHIGPQMHQQAVHSFIRYFDDLQDGFFAAFGVFTTAASERLLDHEGLNNQMDIGRGALALKKFRQFGEPIEHERFAAWLWLGISIIIHAQCALGSSGTLVRRHILSHLHSLGGRGDAFKAHPVVISLIAVDCLECLLYKQVPIFDMPECPELGPDSFLRLCYPLFQHMYTLCRINCRAAFAGSHGQEHNTNENILYTIEYSASCWQPDIYLGSATNLSTVEMAHLLTQARVYKTMVLLVIHRMKYPFGTGDDLAKCMANSIVSDLDLATVTTNVAPTMVSLPFTIASIEAMSQLERIKSLQDISKYVDRVSPKSRYMTRSFLKAMWDIRDESTPLRWLDAMHTLPPLCISLH